MLGEGEFINGVVALKNGGCNPWLEDEPASSVDAAHFLVVVVKGEGAFGKRSVTGLAFVFFFVVDRVTYTGDAEVSASRLTAATDKYCRTMMDFGVRCYKIRLQA